MTSQRLRNLTTRRLHTDIAHVYQDIEYLTGTPGIMTHNIPNALVALKPWLKQKVRKGRFWNGNFDRTHRGFCDIQPMKSRERELFFKRFASMKSPLLGG